MMDQWMEMETPREAHFRNADVVWAYPIHLSCFADQFYISVAAGKKHHLQTEMEQKHARVRVCVCISLVLVLSEQHSTSFRRPLAVAFKLVAKCHFASASSCWWRRRYDMHAGNRTYYCDIIFFKVFFVALTQFWLSRYQREATTVGEILK